MLQVALDANREWGERTGRCHGVLVRYRCDGAQAVIVTPGSMYGTARKAVNALRHTGLAVGMLKIRPLRALLGRFAIMEGER